MAMKKSVGSWAFDIINHFFLLLLVVTMVYPLIRVVALSFSGIDYINAGFVNWLPKGVHVRGYEMILGDPKLWTAYRNTIIYAGGGTFITIFVTSLTAYPLSIREFVFKKPVTIYLAVTMFFSGGLIPTYLLILRLGLINTFWVMVLPGAVAAYNVIVFRTFFQRLPVALRESALLDGANEVKILIRIILPLSKAIIATFALFSIVGHWNSWFSAIIYLQDEWRYPLQVFLKRIVVEEQIPSPGGTNKVMELIRSRSIHPKNVQMAAIVVTMAPILCIYPFIQKYFAKGVLVGTLKG